MAAPCYEQYDHPLLWCEAKRRTEERRNAVETLEVVQQKKEREHFKKIQEANEFRQLLNRNNPWGRPGGGAPNEKIRRANLFLEGLFPESSDAPYRAKRGGGGAPIRNSSGQIITTYREDPSITFSESTRNHVENKLRYSSTPQKKQCYKMELDKCIADKERLQKPIRRYSNENKNDPWGKMGPGGAPWRHPGQVGQSFLKSMGWTDKTLLKTLDTSAVEQKPLQELDESPFKKTEKHNTNSNNNATDSKPKLPSQCCPNCFCDCKAKYSVKHQTVANDQVNKENKVTIANESTKQQQQQPQPHQQLVHAPNAKHCKKCRYVKPRSCLITGGVELVPLLARRRALQRPISLSTTDVTKYPTEKKWEDCGTQKLLDDLCRQMTQKERRTQIYKNIERETSRMHFETLDTFWGRPGHGAPRSIKTKLNLNDLLYKPRT